MGDQKIIKGSPSQYVKLNVGGKTFDEISRKFHNSKYFSGFLYHTTIRTLTKVDCMLRAMFSGKLEVLTDSEGWVSDDSQFFYVNFSSVFTFHSHYNCIQQVKCVLCF